MQLDTLGDTNLTVSCLGLGMAALGRPGYINLGHAEDLEGDHDPAAMEARAHAVLDAAWAAGVRYFDTARSYGRGEEFLGSWLGARDIGGDAVTVGSKWGYTYTAGWQVVADHHEIKEHSLAVLVRQWGESRASLGANLGLYQIHSATLDSGVLDNVAVLEELARLRDQGVAIGLTSSGPGQADVLRRALDVEVDGRTLFSVVQATWNLLERSAEPALVDAAARGIGVIVKEAVANGRLTERNEEPGFAPVLALLREEARAGGTTVDGLAIAAALSRPWTDVVLSGAASVAQLESNLTATADEALASGAAAAERTLAHLAQPPEAYWRMRSALAWN